MSVEFGWITACSADMEVEFSWITASSTDLSVKFGWITACFTNTAIPTAIRKIKSTGSFFSAQMLCCVEFGWITACFTGHGSEAGNLSLKTLFCCGESLAPKLESGWITACSASTAASTTQKMRSYRFEGICQLCSAG